MALASLVLLSGCGDDDDDDDAAPAGGGTTTSAAAGAAAPQEWCEDVARVQFVEPEVPEDAPPEEQERIERAFFNDEFLPLVKKIEQEAPSEAKPDMAAIARFFEDKGPAAFEDEALLPIETRANEAAARACRGPSTAVTAADYAFEGVPASLKPGVNLLRLTNSGTELHEMVLLRKKPTTTESFPDLFARAAEEGPEVVQDKVDEAGFGFAFPGTTDTAVVDLDPGDYVMACFIPVGFTPEAAEQAEESGQEPEGPPHVARGMLREFKVA